MSPYPDPPTDEAPLPYPPPEDPDLQARIAEHHRIHAYTKRLKTVRPRVTRVLLTLNLALGVVLILPWPKLAEGLLMWGVLVPSLVVDGELWRLLTAMFLHGGSLNPWAVGLHLGVNMYALWILGPFVEALYGSARFLGLYLLTGVGSSLVSMAFLPAAPSVGASGALFGLIGVIGGLALLNRGLLPAEVERRLRVRVPILVGINLMLGLSLPNINNHAHVGGLLFGVAASLLVTPRLPGVAQRRRLTAPVALLITASLLVLAVVSKRRAELPLHYALSYMNYAHVTQPRALEKAARLMERAMDTSPVLVAPERALVLNLQAWTWVLLNQELGRAGKQAREAVALEPVNPAYLDTLAYVEAMEGRCAEARVWIDRAVTLDPRYKPRRSELLRACDTGRLPDPDIPFSEPGASSPGVRI